MNHLGGHFNITHVDSGALCYLKDTFNIKSMLDIGCGPGGMLQIANKYKISYTGIDGDPKIPLKPPHFIRHDFTNKFNKHIKADLSWSVEFLEHVEEIYIPNFMELFQNTKITFCTAAPPNKEGYHHVNCKPIDYWIDIFEKFGLKYSEKHTRAIRKSSTMKREFVRTTGMVFINGTERA